MFPVFNCRRADRDNVPTMVAGEKSGCERWISTLRSRPKDRPFFLWLAALDPAP